MEEVWEVFLGINCSIMDKGLLSDRLCGEVIILSSSPVTKETQDCFWWLALCDNDDC